jgi:hypothetical protein
MFAAALAEREPDVTSVSLHPGIVSTDLGRHILPQAVQSISQSSGFAKTVSSKLASLVGLLTPQEGAMMSLELAGARKAAVRNGAFYVGLGLTEGPIDIAPLLHDRVLCGELFDNTIAWIEKQA